MRLNDHVQNVLEALGLALLAALVQYAITYLQGDPSLLPAGEAGLALALLKVIADELRLINPVTGTSLGSRNSQPLPASVVRALAMDKRTASVADKVPTTVDNPIAQPFTQDLTK